MAEQDSATGRTVALIGLLIVSGAALRGTLPPAGTPEHRQVTAGPAAPLLLAVLLVGSLGIVAAAIINRMRNRRATDRGIRVLADSPGGDLPRSAWRMLAIGLAVLAGWLLVIWVLGRLAGQPMNLGLIPPSDNPAGPPAIGDTPAPVTPPAGGPTPRPVGDIVGYLAGAAVAVVALSAAAVAAAGRRGPATAGPPAPADRPTPDLARAAALGLAEIDRAGLDPRRAIIACYAAMERQLRQVPAAQPQPCDTPTEVLARAIDQHALTPGNATALVALFAEARFSAHPMTERHRVQAVDILSRVLHELREPA